MTSFDEWFRPDGVTSEGHQMYSLTEKAWEEMTSMPDCVLPCFFRAQCSQFRTCVDVLNG